jgi:Peptidase propeptide and YPEB domain
MARRVRNRGFVIMAGLAMVCRAGAWWALMACSAANAAGAWCAFIGCAAAYAAEVEPHAAAKPVCLNAAETREMVKSRRLLEPFAALKFAGAQHKAEALSARLCRTGDDFVYEITLLHRDGRLVHVEMEAATGKIALRPTREPHETHEPHEPPAKN